MSRVSHHRADGFSTHPPNPLDKHVAASGLVSGQRTDRADSPIATRSVDNRNRHIGGTAAVVTENKRRGLVLT